ncbi:WAT1-related protein [Quillaja saponaria]|uniref:WAT1-related protein n=1 Tax=Quillaja saponaria TaxID=32244 RepID=A0AAD7Q758_QUISA|nr:WAT1-related protein [Quillaja saponaria]
MSSQSDMEDEDDLFEINLDAVNCIPPPHYWESYFTATGNALLANCLMPISDISSAVPACSAVSMAGKTSVVVIAEPMTLGELLRLPFFAAFGMPMKETENEYSCYESDCNAGSC